MNILIVGDPGGRDDEGMKRVNNHLRKELIALGHNCVIDSGTTLKANVSSWDKIVFTGGPGKRTLNKIALMRPLHWRAEFIVCGLMPSIRAEKNAILRRCINKVVSENPQMLELAALNGIPVVQQTAATFSFEKFLRGRERTKPLRRDGPLRILHVGHLNKKRNVFELASLCRKLSFPLTFLVGSTEKEELEERRRLEEMGAQIVSGYQNDLFEFYRQFDLYAFPVKRADAAISMPLSIIEALLAGLNVLSTDFGEVSTYFGASDHVEITDDLENLTAARLEDLATRPVMHIANLKQFDTKQFAQTIAGTL